MAQVISNSGHDDMIVSLLLYPRSYYFVAAHLGKLAHFEDHDVPLICHCSRASEDFG